MKLVHTFTVPVPVDKAWEVLLDLPRIAPCMPGATLTGVEGDEFTGTVKVKLGPIGLTYSGKGRFVERDEAAHRVVVEASGRDTRSAGTAGAMITATLAAESADETRVDVVTDLTVTGKPAQFGRGMISDVSGKLLGQFADCVATKLAGGGERVAATAAVGDTVVGDTAVGDTVVGDTAVGDTAVGAAETPSRSGGHGPKPAGDATAAPAEAEAVDLFRLAGSTDAARRTAVYGLGALLLAVLAWVLVRALRNR